MTFAESGALSTSLNVRLDSEHPSSSIVLPVPVVTSGPNALATRAIADRLEIKLTSRSSGSQSGDGLLLDATHLNKLHPTNFICSSCSLPLIQCRAEGGSDPLAFADLPSEYWTELVEAWMCHSEQKLSDDVVKQSKGGARGTQPSPAQALVGGSYILVDASVVKEGNVRIPPPTKVRFKSLSLSVLFCFLAACCFVVDNKESHRRSITPVVDCFQTLSIM